MQNVSFYNMQPWRKLIACLHILFIWAVCVSEDIDVPIILAERHIRVEDFYRWLNFWLLFLSEPSLPHWTLVKVRMERSPLSIRHLYMALLPGQRSESTFYTFTSSVNWFWTNMCMTDSPCSSYPVAVRKWHNVAFKFIFRHDCKNCFILKVQISLTLKML